MIREIYNMAFAVCLLGEHGYGKDGGLGEGFSLAFRHTIRCVHADDEGSVARDFVGLVDGGCYVLGLMLEDLKALLYVALHEECRHGWVGEIAVFYG